MELRVALYRAKSWLRHQLTAWNTGGEGVHSPYLFEWVRMVLHDENAYYAWDKIEEVRTKMLGDEREVEFVDYGSGRENGDNGQVKMRRVCDIARVSLAKRKYTSRDTASTMVVMKGLAITAGSSLTAFAAMGSRQPTTLAAITVTQRDRHTTRSTIRVIS